MTFLSDLEVMGRVCVQSAIHFSHSAAEYVSSLEDENEVPVNTRCMCKRAVRFLFSPFWFLENSLNPGFLDQVGVELCFTAHRPNMRAFSFLLVF